MADASGARTLILLAHPALERSRINTAMLEAARSGAGATVRDLYELYPDFAVDVSEEQAELARRDVIVMQFPLYWYSSPALLKEWLDLVLEHGWAYGDRGRALAGKVLACAVSTGGREDAYVQGGYNRFSLEDFFRPFEQTAHVCQMRWAEPFAVHGAAICSEVHISEQSARYQQWLAALTDMADA
ncbi:MAG: glutathione-regulated potassium-efflux system oxidoreductase KefF [Caulobacteraceae bacterium]